MTVTAVGLGPVGRAVSSLLAERGHEVVVASRSSAKAASLVDDIGGTARSRPTREAISEADVVVLAVPFGAVEDIVARYGDGMTDTVVVDPTNALTVTDDGRFLPVLPDGRSAGSVVAALLPPDAHYVKALGTTTAAMLRTGTDRTPRRAVLPYATDDEVAASAVESLIAAIGFDAVPAGGAEAARRLEMFGDLHTLSGFSGRLVDAEEFAAVLSRTAARAAGDRR